MTTPHLIINAQEIIVPTEYLNEDKDKITLKKYRASDKLKFIHYISTVKVYNLL